jgi:hypothetical protein
LKKIKNKVNTEFSQINLQFEDKGYISFSFDKIIAEQIKFLLKNEISDIEIRTKNKIDNNLKIRHNDNNMFLTREFYPEIYDLVNSIYKNSEVTNIIKVNQNNVCNVKKIFLQYNCNNITLRKFGFILNGIPINNPAKYLHIDSSHSSQLKSLIYLDAVNDLSGPFRYVINSHKWLTIKELALRKTFDFYYKNKSYYLKNYVLNVDFDNINLISTDFMKKLLKNEISITSSGPEIILFNVNGIHRGSFVSGENPRIILQCLFD